MAEALRGLGAGLGRVLDCGCGRGQFAGLLLIEGLAERVIGLEGNPRLLGQAREALGGLGFEGRRLDLASAPPLPPADTVLLIDVLYQLPPEAQFALLGRLGETGARRIVIRTADPSAGWRSLVGALAERAGRRFWPHSGAHVAPQPPSLLAGRLRQLGFAVAVAPCHRGTPFANVLLLASRP